MIKYRMKTWYWGKFITEYDLIRLKIDFKDLEEYDEEAHGWHNSEEYKLELGETSGSKD